MITRVRPAPYCSPAMRKTLADLVAGKEVDTRSITGAAVLESLRSRGWVKNGKPTDAGRAYLAGSK